MSNLFEKNIAQLSSAFAVSILIYFRRLNNEKSIKKLQNNESVRGLFVFNEAIELKTKLNEADITLKKDNFAVKGELRSFEVPYAEIKTVILYKWYSKVFNGAVVEVKFGGDTLLVAATSFVLFKNFVSGKRAATLEIFNLLSKLCTHAEILKK